MTTPERIKALQNFGYDADEASFLCVAALQSGYFLRRQHLAFIKGTKGWKDVVLLNKLKANRHCRMLVYRHDRMVYHLSAKPLYAALGEPDNRNRREHQPSTIKNKIMALDFVLEHPDHDFLSTERQKLDYFIRSRNVAPEDLPTRLYASPRGHDPAAKHFVDPFPIFLAAPAGGAPVPHFAYVDEGLQTTDRFATYLRQYHRLLRTLGDFRVIYVAEHSRLFASAERVFQKFAASFSGADDSLEPEQERLLGYFKRRQAYENQDFSDFDTAALIRLRQEKKHFAGERYEGFYSRWKAGDRAVLGETVSAGQSLPTTSPRRFSTHVLEHDYDLFGTLTSSNPKRRNAEVPTEP